MKKELIISKLRGLVKRHFYILALFFITLIFFSSILSSSKILSNIHYINDMTFQSENIRKDLHEFRVFPLWTPYFYSGEPFMAIPEHYLFDLNFLYIFLFKNIFLSMNLAVISYFFLAGLGMYLLVYEIMRKQNAAFIAALVFMFNELMHSFILTGHLNILESYALMPFVFLFTYKALHKKEWLRNSIIASLFFSLMIYSGGMIFFLYTGLIIGTYMAWNLIGTNFKKRLVKTILVSLIIGVLLLGLSALKLLPVLEFVDMSSRGAGVSYEEYLGNPINLSNFWNHLINLSVSSGFSGAIGIASLVLLLFGLLSFRKKIVMYSTLLIILSILLAAGTIVAKFVFQLPGFGQMRHIERALVMFVFASPIIIAYGFNNLANIFRKYNKNIKEWIIFLVVVAILLVELMFIQKFPTSIDIVKPEDIPILEYISEDEGTYRTLNLALKDLIGHSGYNYNSQLGIPTVKGGGGIWINDYIIYLSIAQQYAPSKLWGILNTKYVISDEEIQNGGLEFIEKFSECEECPIANAWGPYLYENKDYMPRAYLVNRAILVLGETNSVRQLNYQLMLDKFNPENTVIITGSEVNDYQIEFLKNFKAIILLKDSVDQSSFPLLRKYIDFGGVLLPNIIKGDNSITPEDINNLFEELKGNYSEIEFSYYSPNEIQLNVNGKKGFLVLSERYAYFPGWEASLDSKETEIMKANNVISSVYLDGGDEKLIFKYKPKSFKNGTIVTTITLLIILAYFSIVFYKKVKKRKS